MSCKKEPQNHNYSKDKFYRQSGEIEGEREIDRERKGGGIEGEKEGGREGGRREREGERGRGRRT